MVSVTLENEEAASPGLLPDGGPDPEYADALGLRSAPAGRRALAFTLDLAVWLALSIPGVIAVFAVLVEFAANPTALAARLGSGALLAHVTWYALSQGLMLAFGTVQLVLHGRRGVTLGKAALRLRSVNVAGFGAPGFWRVLLRALVLTTAAVILPLLGPALLLASPLRDARGRGWLDVIGRTWVIDVRHGLDPFDAKALRHARKAAAMEETDTPAALPSLATGIIAPERLFVPAARSSSGVIGAPNTEAGEPWQPPPIGPRPVASRRGAVLVFDDGTRVAVDGDGLLGRAPQPRPGETFALLVPVFDESMQISKTHAAFGLDERGFWMSDRGSVNGTVVTSGGIASTLPPETRHHLAWGSSVQLGSRRFTVEQAGHDGPAS